MTEKGEEFNRKRAIEAHGNKYDYSKTNFKRINDRVTITCPEHGDFVRGLHLHIKGKGKCPLCMEKETSAYNKNRAIEIHGNKYDYSKTYFSSIRSKTTITCPEHGDFVQYLSSHINQGNGCPKCAKEQSSISNSYSKKFLRERFIKEARKVHKNKYDYSKVSYKDKKSIDKVTIICPEHGEFQQTYGNHVTLGHKCPGCSFSKQGIKDKVDGIYGTSEDRMNYFLETSKSIHQNAYSYPFVEEEFVNYLSYITIKCHDCGKHIKQLAHNHMRGHGCKYCKRSAEEKSIAEWVQRKLKGTRIICNSRDILDSGLELDIYVPIYKLALEYGSNFYHSDQKVGKNYHQVKWKECNNRGINLLTFFDNEWYDINKRLIIKYKIKYYLNRISNRIYARNCSIHYSVDTDKERRFLERNHIQGYSPSSIKLGLYHGNRLVSLLTLGRPRFNKSYEYEIIRYCGKRSTVVIGGFSKLLSKFIKDYDPDSIITYADLRWGKGDIYHKSGFRFEGTTEPCAWYTSVYPNQKFHHRMKFQKHRLKNLLPGFDPNKTARENIADHNYVAVYDCGHNKYVYTKEGNK